MCAECVHRTPVWPRCLPSEQRWTLVHQLANTSKRLAGILLAVLFCAGWMHGVCWKSAMCDCAVGVQGQVCHKHCPHSSLQPCCPSTMHQTKTAPGCPLNCTPHATRLDYTAVHLASSHSASRLLASSPSRVPIHAGMLMHSTPRRSRMFAWRKSQEMHSASCPAGTQLTRPIRPADCVCVIAWRTVGGLMSTPLLQPLVPACPALGGSPRGPVRWYLLVAAALEAIHP